VAIVRSGAAWSGRDTNDEIALVLARRRWLIITDKRPNAVTIWTDVDEIQNLLMTLVVIVCHHIPPAFPIGPTVSSRVSSRTILVSHKLRQLQSAAKTFEPTQVFAPIEMRSHS